MAAGGGVLKELSGNASIALSVSPQRMLELLRAVDAYPAWFGERIREVTVVEHGADGLPSVVRATLRVEVGPFAQDVHAMLRVSSDQRGVTLTRVQHEPDDPEELVVSWAVAPSSLSVELSARLDVPRLLPLGGVGESIARDFVQAAARAVADDRGSSPNSSASNS